MSEPLHAGPGVEQAPTARALRRGHRWLAVVVAGTAALSAACSSAAEGDAPPVASPAPRFVDETATSGLDQVYDGEYEFFVGGGVAVLDCDADGFDDLYLAGGSGPAALYRNESPVGGPLRFTRVPAPTTDLTAVTGAYPLDVDSDGTADLAVVRNGGNRILRGTGGCTFDDVTEQLGVASAIERSAAFSAMWEGDATLPTLAFGAYLDLDRTACGTSELFRPSRGGAGYEAPVPLRPGHCVLSMLFSDWNRTGRRDLRLSNDREYYTDGTEQLWRVDPGVAPRLYSESDGWRPLRIWGMGIASQDVTDDGLPEVFLSSQGDNKLQTLADGPERPAYEDIALRLGVTAQRPFAGGDVLPSTAWHAEFDDVNNDGLVDLFVSKGNVEAQPTHAMRDPSNLFLGRADGTFAEGAEEAGIVDFGRARGAALADLDLDGLLDLVVVHRRAPVKVWRNAGAGDAGAARPMGHWLAVRLRQPTPNVDAVGAWVEVRTEERVLAREVTVGGGHAGGQLGWVHAGLGDADRAEVRVTWPDGERSGWMEAGADQFVLVERGSDRPVPWQPEESER